MLSASVVAATLEPLSLGELTEKSTAIVRAKAAESRMSQDGALFYTVTALAVLETLKGDAVSRVEVSLPGGHHGALTQRFGGVPYLHANREYLLFLWTGPSGRTQITGLSQGFFEVIRVGDAPARVRRSPLAVADLPPSATDSALVPPSEMLLPDLVAQIRAALAASSPADLAGRIGLP